MTRDFDYDSAKTYFGPRSADDLRDVQVLVANAIAGTPLQWRRHGIGCLQAYVFEGAQEEFRIHVWSERLMLPGIAESGNIHNHRFNLSSRVLLGKLEHTEYLIHPDEDWTHETYDFVHARLHTDENRADMRATGDRYSVESGMFIFSEGSRYTFPRGAFHSSRALTPVVVTFCTKRDQRDERAQVLAPVGTKPVPAFGGPKLEHKDYWPILEEAIEGLRRGAL